MTKKNRMYFDYAASTPVDPRVLRVMQPYFSRHFGNPGSLHSFGQEAMAAVDRARQVIAAALGAQFREIIFTASATEANNLVLRGAVAAGIKHLVISAVEHESVLETARALKATAGVEVTELPVDRQGIVKLDALAASLQGSTPALVSLMYANNETGAIQPLAKIAKIIRAVPEALWHTDAAQAFQFLDCNVTTLDVDFLTLSAHKIYGPKGIGVLYIKDASSRAKGMLRPVITGGGQEFGLRSGTENVPLVAGFGAAVEYIEQDKEKHARRVAALKDRLTQGVKKIHPRAALNGPENGLPHIANLWLPGVRAEDALIRLDLAGIAVSAGSACTARSSQPSHVLRAMGFSDVRARESVRVSLARPTTSGEITRLLKAMAKL